MRFSQGWGAAFKATASLELLVARAMGMARASQRAIRAMAPAVGLA